MKRLQAASARFPRKKKKEEAPEPANVLDEEAALLLLEEAQEAGTRAEEEGVGAYMSTFKSRKLKLDRRVAKSMVNRAEKTNAYIVRKRDKAANDETDGSKPKSNPLDRDSPEGGTRSSNGGNQGASQGSDAVRPPPGNSAEEDDDAPMFVYSKMDTYF